MDALAGMSRRREIWASQQSKASRARRQGDKFETLIDEATPDESERKRRQSAAEEDIVKDIDDDEEE